MRQYLTRHWWVLVVRGVLAIIFGLLAVGWPAITLFVLAIVFGAYALVDGVFAALSATRATPRHRAPLILEAAVGIGLGIVTLAWPRATLLAIILLLGAWAVVTGVAAIVAAVRLRRQLRGEWAYLLSGAISILFGLLILFWPASGAVAVGWLIGVYAIIAGILLIAAGIGIRNARNKMDTTVR
jgi:uncharacterized membrane protein HdeD (DUF308 family)